MELSSAARSIPYTPTVAAETALLASNFFAISQEPRFMTAATGLTGSGDWPEPCCSNAARRAAIEPDSERVGRFTGGSDIEQKTQVAMKIWSTAYSYSGVSVGNQFLYGMKGTTLYTV